MECTPQTHPQLFIQVRCKYGTIHTLWIGSGVWITNEWDCMGICQDVVCPVCKGIEGCDEMDAPYCMDCNGTGKIKKEIT